MKKDEYYRGRAGRKYGVWNSVRKCFQFDVCEDTPMLAEARLFQKIGNDARKWRFEPRPLPELPSEETNNLRIELERVKRERDAAVSCIYSIEDDLNRGSDNDWAREHIAEWEKGGQI